MIGQAVGEVLAFGVGVALSPLAIVAVVVMLVARGGAPAAWMFAGAWVVSLTLASTLVLLLADGADASAAGEPATWVSIVKIVVGLLLVLFGVRSWGERVSRRLSRRRHERRSAIRSGTGICDAAPPRTCPVSRGRSTRK